MLNTESGLVYIFTGEGKGKTSAAIATAVRALLEDKPVVWVAFYKQESWGIAEKKLTSKFDKLKMFFTGEGFKLPESASRNKSGRVKYTEVAGGKAVVVDAVTSDKHKEAARRGIEIASEALVDKPFLLVLDEVVNAVSDGLVTEEEVLSLIGSRGSTHVVLTGRGVTPKLVEEADLVTECRKIKHPYDKDKLAVKGLDY